MATSVRIGNIYELVTQSGYAYVQYTHCDSLMGDLIRVFPCTYIERPKRIGDLAMGSEAFFVYYPLKAAVKQKLVKYVASEVDPVFWTVA